MARLRTRRSALLSLAIGALAFNANFADAALVSCVDLRTPKITSTNPVAPPSLLSPGATPGYASALANNNTVLEFYVQSQPGAGTGDNRAYTRDVKLVLAGPSTADWDSAQGVNERCKFHTARFRLENKPAEVTITSQSSLVSAPADGDAELCFFNHRYTIPLADFKDSSKVNYCGFATSEETVNGVTYEVLSGRIHLRWADYDALDAAQSVRPPFSTYYPISIRLAKEIKESNPRPTDVVPKDVYSNDFQIKQYTYSRTGSQIVLRIAYNISLAYPHYPYLPPSPALHLIRTNHPISSLPNVNWTSEILGGVNGTSCSATKCILEGELSAAFPATASCPLASSIPLQFDFWIGCMATGTACGKRVAELAPEAGVFLLQGTKDLCATSAAIVGTAKGTDLQVQSTGTEGKPQQTKPVIEQGKPIAISANFTSPHAIRSIHLRELVLLRQDLTGSEGWKLWNEVGANLIFPDGSRTDMGAKVNLQRDFRDLGDGLSWILNLFVTPNAVQGQAGVAVETNYAGDRAGAMIVLPGDQGKNVTFEARMKIRMFFDPVEGVKRMVKRQTTSLADPEPIDEFVLSGRFWMNVTANATQPAQPAVPTEGFQITTKFIVIVAVLGSILMSGIVTMMVLGCKDKRRKSDEELRCERDRH